MAKNEVAVYSSDPSAPGFSGTPIIGGGPDGPTATGEISATESPTGTLWVSVINGSLSMHGIQFDLTETPTGGDAAPAPPVDVATDAAENVEVKIKTLNDPNNPKGSSDDWTGTTPRWLVGQMVQLEAKVTGPKDLINGLTYRCSVFDSSRSDISYSAKARSGDAAG